MTKSLKSESTRQEQAGKPAEDERSKPLVPAALPSPSSLPAETDMVGTTAYPPRAVYPLGLSRQDIRRSFLLLLAATVACYFLWLVQSILPPFLIAFFLAALLDPALRAAERRGRSRVRAILMFYLLAFLLIVAFAVLVVPNAKSQFDDINANFSSYYANFQQRANVVLHQNVRLLRLFHINESNLTDIINHNTGPLKIAGTALLGGITGFLAGLASKAIWFIIIPIAGFFLTRDYPILRARIIALMPEVYQERVDVLSREVVDVFGAYLRGLAKICALYAFCAFVLLMVLGVRYALLVALVAGLFYAVPYLGQLMTATVVGAVTYSMERHVLGFVLPVSPVIHTLMAVGAMIVMNNVFDQIVYPRVVGGSVGLHPVVSIFALAAGATLFGIWGMLLAVPVAASIQIVLVYAFPKLTQPPPAHLVNVASPDRASVSN